MGNNQNISVNISGGLCSGLLLFVFIMSLVRGCNDSTLEVECRNLGGYVDKGGLEHFCVKPINHKLENEEPK